MLYIKYIMIFDLKKNESKGDLNRTFEYKLFSHNKNYQH